MNNPLPRLPGLRGATCGLALLLSQFAVPRTALAEAEPAFLVESSAKASLASSRASARGPQARAVKAHPRLREMPRVRLDLADGVIWEAERVRVDVLAGGDFVWVGRLIGEPLSEVTLASRGGVLAGVVDRPLETGNEVYSIQPSAGGFSLLAEYRGPGEGRDGCQSIDPPAAPAGSRSKRSLQSTASAPMASLYAPASETEPAIVDVLVIYTPATSARYGGAAGAEALVLQAIASANTAYQNSGVHITLNLIHTAEVPYVETGDMNVTLSRLATQLDGHLEDAHILRAQYGADVVVLLDEDANYCGLSYQMGTPNPAFATSAFSVVHSGCVSSYTVTHELGHVMGSNHDRDNAYGTPSYPYSYGQKRCMTDGTGFRCLMSYNCASAAVPRVNYFSSPLVTFNGYPTGTDYDADPANSADNVRSLNNTALFVANFRTRVEPLPTAPTGLTATAPSASVVALAWADNANNEVCFQVERSPDATVWTQIASLAPDVIAHEDNGLVPDTALWYRTRACNATGCSEWTPVVSVTVPSAVLGVPADLAATTGPAPDSAVLTWTDTATVETGTEIERSTDGATWLPLAGVSANVTSWTDAGLAYGQDYSYRVRACDGGGCTEWSGTASIVLQVPVPAAPSGLAGTAASNSQINLTWTDNASNETGYRVERSANGVSYSVIATLAADATAYANSGLTPGTTYHYRIIATNACGDSDSSNAISVTTPAGTPPTAPDRLAASSVSSSEIKLTWRDRSSNETGFRIERSTDGTNFTVLTTVNANTTSYRNTGLPSKKKYWYRICAVNGGLSSAYTSVVSATTR